MGQSSQRRTFATMTARADRLTKRAKTAGSASSVRSSYPASSARVFVDALERLNYSVESLLCDAGICRADLDDPDARIPCELWGAMFRQALALRPMKNVGVRLATVTRRRSPYVEALDFVDDAALHYAEVRADLKRRGTQIGANDLFITARALARLTLVRPFR